MKTLHFASIDSTNTYLLNHYKELEHFTFVSADVQTAGKGRNQRVWKSENGSNLLFSLLIRDSSFFEYYRAISMVCAYSVLSVLRDFGVTDAMIKWPNDVYVGGKKICGILLQGVAVEEMECLVAGIGINVNQTFFDGDYLHQPTSVALQVGKVDLEVFKHAVYTQLEQDLNALVQGKRYLEVISEVDFLKGRSCFAEIDNEKKPVQVLGINQDYELDVVVDNQIRSVGSGEITFHLDESF
ncbi:MAG: biotin--[acetyl-CoA-carboxylase] ligase [Erysipelotrichaceae bacterium]|nr:biotin--[acetyl-CoA-carboxylase] ligase [Erysipelotrichaceae bacterium]